MGVCVDRAHSLSGCLQRVDPLAAVRRGTVPPGAVTHSGDGPRCRSRTRRAAPRLVEQQPVEQAIPWSSSPWRAAARSSSPGAAARGCRCCGTEQGARGGKRLRSPVRGGPGYARDARLDTQGWSRGPIRPAGHLSHRPPVAGCPRLSFCVPPSLPMPVAASSQRPPRSVLFFLQSPSSPSSSSLRSLSLSTLLSSSSSVVLRPPRSGRGSPSPAWLAAGCAWPPRSSAFRGWRPASRSWSPVCPQTHRLSSNPGPTAG